MIELREYRDCYFDQNIREIRYRSNPESPEPSIGDRKAIEFLWNEADEDHEGFVPQYQWSLWEYIGCGWADNPFHLLASSRFHEAILTEEDARAFVENRTKPAVYLD